MAIRCLNKEQKDYITLYYTQKLLNQKELADRYYVSERTINRVLIEAGIATPVARIQGEAYHVMKLLEKYGLDRVSLTAMLEGFNAQRAA